MHFFYIILVALANNLDNFSVRIAYSLRGIKIPALINLWISSITFFIVSISALLGKSISDYFNQGLSSFISMILLVSIGTLLIREQFIRKNETKNIQKTNLLNILRKPEIADLDGSKIINFKEATLLGFVLSLDNVGGGISIGIMGFNMFLIGLFSAVISFLALWVGNYLSNFLNRHGLGKIAAVASGMILIIIGLKQYIFSCTN